MVHTSGPLNAGPGEKDTQEASVPPTRGSMWRETPGMSRADSLRVSGFTHP